MKSISILLLLASLDSLADESISGALSILLETGETSSFVHVGNNIRSKLSARRRVFSLCTIRVVLGDAQPPIGDGTATNHAYISCPGYRDLGVRLKADQEGKHHIVGYWSM
ncbi:hypothetical protein ACJJIE_04510 [Microbulbifer sp. TRSA001]|uniref:hypothetical protein n=1 Tax=Microbulbifer sp. TRSA001 TaxID=3243381 RepID=UPI004039C071